MILTNEQEKNSLGKNGKIKSSIKFVEIRNEYFSLHKTRFKTIDDDYVLQVFFTCCSVSTYLSFREQDFKVFCAVYILEVVSCTILFICTIFSPSSWIIRGVNPMTKVFALFYCIRKAYCSVLIDRQQTTIELRRFWKST